MKKPLAQSDPQLRAEFDRCWPWLRASLRAFGPTHTKEQLLARLLTRRAFLWAGKDCVIVGELIDYAIGMRSFNYWLQGGNLKELLTLHPGIEEWAKACGCHRVMRQGREGWVRAMQGGWQKGPVYSMKWLTEPPRQMRESIDGQEAPTGS